MRTALILVAAGALVCAAPAIANATTPHGSTPAPAATQSASNVAPAPATATAPAPSATAAASSAAPAAPGAETSAATPAPQLSAVQARAQMFDDPRAQDRELTFRVTERLGALDPQDTSDVHVHARRGGAVLLYGTVRNAAALDRVLLTTNDVEGVRVVRNELTLGAPEAAPPQDAARGGGPRGLPLDATVRSALRNDPGVVGRPLRVSAQGNAVTLQGRVATYGDAYRITERVRAIPGVAVVRPQLIVNQSYVVDIDNDHNVIRWRPSARR